jgi:hypothetical protein
MNLLEKVEIPFDSLNFMISVIIYGGRVTDDKDSRLIDAFINQFINSNNMD